MLPSVLPRVASPSRQNSSPHSGAIQASPLRQKLRGRTPASPRHKNDPSTGKYKAAGLPPQAYKFVAVPLIFVVGFIIFYNAYISSNIQVDPKPGHMPNWRQGHQKLAQEMAIACKENAPYDLLWYGDSITESFREEVRGNPCTLRCDGISNVWQEQFGPSTGLKAAAFGSSGDTTEHLLWRLLEGESPACPGAHVVVILIGTNDLGIAALEAGPNSAARAVASAAPKASKGAQEVAKALRFLLPDCHIVVAGLLPRGLKDRSNPEKPVIYHNLPSIFTSPIQRVNRELSKFVEGQQQMQFVDCGDLFLTSGGDLEPELMPDALHPNAAGMRLLAECVSSVVMPLLGRTIPGAS